MTPSFILVQVITADESTFRMILDPHQSVEYTTAHIIAEVGLRYPVCAQASANADLAHALYHRGILCNHKRTLAELGVMSGEVLRVRSQLPLEQLIGPSSKRPSMARSLSGSAPASVDQLCAQAVVPGCDWVVTSVSHQHLSSMMRNIANWAFLPDLSLSLVLALSLSPVFAPLSGTGTA
jgi:hypothetical protein